MSTLKTHNLQSPDASNVNIAMAPNAGIIVTGISTFQAGIKVSGGVIDAPAGQHKVAALYNNFSDLPSAGTYHGMFAHVHNRQKGYFAHGGAWYELVNKKLDGTIGVGTEQVNVGVLTATTLYGDGSNLTNLPPSAPVGGSASNKVFFENDKVVSVNYQITSTKNAMTAGPVSVNAGIAVTVPSGCSWTIV